MDATIDKRTTSVNGTFEAEALARFKTAETMLALARENVGVFVRAHFRMTAGGLIYFSNRQRDWLDAELRDLTIAYDRALTEFNSALAAWGKYK